MSEADTLSNRHKIASFNHLIGSLDGGKVHRALTDALLALIAETETVRNEGSGPPKGHITVKLAVGNNRGTIEITPAINVVMPKRTHKRESLFLTPDMALSRYDPAQMDIEDRLVRVVDTSDTAAVVKDLG